MTTDLRASTDEQALWSIERLRLATNGCEELSDAERALWAKRVCHPNVAWTRPDEDGPFPQSHRDRILRALAAPVTRSDFKHCVCEFTNLFDLFVNFELAALRAEEQRAAEARAALEAARPKRLFIPGRTLVRLRRRFAN